MSNLQNALVFGTAVELLNPAAVTEDTDGTGIDVTAYEGEAVVILHSAAGTGTDPTLDVHVEESTDDSTYTDISGATFTQIDDTAGGSIQAILINVSAAAQYIRAAAEVTGTTPSFTCSAAFYGIKKTV